ncbi:tetratricopeptide repeat protein [Pseudomonas sp. NPDC087336]|uniref:tetratricopeptide repeat protein n=1 Tax=Pseudomonas sp. NPDC087336 TaxID=3364436 RepID=UPI0037F87646
MDPISAPICSALVLTICSFLGLRDEEKIADGLRGLAGNLAAGTIDANARRILSKLSDKTKDPTTGLPCNFEIQQASLEALRGAGFALLLEIGRQMEPRKPWIASIVTFVRSGRFGKEPLLAALDRPDLQSLEAIERALQSDSFVTWHEAISLTEFDIATCFQGQRCSLGNVLLQRFRAWLRHHVCDEALFSNIELLLLDGWSSAGAAAPKLRFDDIYCLLLRESFKQKPEIFNILLADQFGTQAQIIQTTAQRTLQIQELLAPFVADSAVLLSGLDTTIQEIRVGQSELSNFHCELVTALAMLRNEVLHGDVEAVTQIESLQGHIEQLSNAFSTWERKLFGLPLVRPIVPSVQAKNEGGYLWLIQAKYRALDLIGRDADLASLWQWLHSDAPISIRLVTGRAGAGKTRIGFELIWKLARERGDTWDAGRIESLQLRRLNDHSHPQDWQWNKPTLVLLDYARAGGDALETLLRELARRSDDQGLPKFRLLLLERSQSVNDNWLKYLREIEHVDGGHCVGTLLDPPDPVELKTLDSLGQRRALFVAALAKISTTGKRIQVPELGANNDFDQMLARPDWADPLVPVMAALVAADRQELMAAMHLTRMDLAEKIARTESQRLLKFGQLHGLKHQGEQRLLLHVAALVVLCGGVTAKEIRKIARIETETLALNVTGGPGQVAWAIAEAWPDIETIIGNLQPDLVAEAFVLNQFEEPKHVQDARDAMLRHVGGHEYMIAALILRAFQNFQMDRPKAEALSFLVSALIGQGLATREEALLAALDEAMPLNTVALRQSALRIKEARLDALRSRFDDSHLSQYNRLELAYSTYSLAIRLSHVGDYQEALVAAQMAVENFRALAAENPDLFSSALASSLNSMANRLSEIGHREGAVTMAEEAVVTFRALFAQNPDYLHELANSLSTFANCLGEMRNYQRALSTGEEAVECYRILVKKDPDTYRPNLTNSLNNLAILLSEVGRFHDAFDPAKEAMEGYRALVAKYPDAYLPDLAMSLSNLSICMFELGDRKARGPGEEAVRLYRTLAAQHSDAFHSALASSLINLANSLSLVGDYHEAFKAAEEAVEIFGALELKHPGVFLPDLANSTQALAFHLIAMDRHYEAIFSLNQAVKSYRALVVENPRAFRPNLLKALHNLALCHYELRESKKAIAAAKEAKEVHNDLVVDTPDVHYDLAEFIKNLQKFGLL